MRRVKSQPKPKKKDPFLLPSPSPGNMQQIRKCRESLIRELKENKEKFTWSDIIKFLEVTAYTSHHEDIHFQNFFSALRQVDSQLIQNVTLDVRTDQGEGVWLRAQTISDTIKNLPSGVTTLEFGPSIGHVHVGRDSESYAWPLIIKGMRAYKENDLKTLGFHSCIISQPQEIIRNLPSSVTVLDLSGSTINNAVPADDWVEVIANSSLVEIIYSLGNETTVAAIEGQLEKNRNKNKLNGSSQPKVSSLSLSTNASEKEEEGKGDRTHDQSTDSSIPEVKLTVDLSTREGVIDASESEIDLQRMMPPEEEKSEYGLLNGLIQRLRQNGHSDRAQVFEAFDDKTEILALHTQLRNQGELEARNQELNKRLAEILQRVPEQREDQRVLVRPLERIQQELEELRRDQENQLREVRQQINQLARGGQNNQQAILDLQNRDRQLQSAIELTQAGLQSVQNTLQWLDPEIRRLKMERYIKSIADFEVSEYVTGFEETMTNWFIGCRAIASGMVTAESSANITFINSVFGAADDIARLPGVNTIKRIIQAFDTHSQRQMVDRVSAIASQVTEFERMFRSVAYEAAILLEGKIGTPDTELQPRERLDEIWAQIRDFIAEPIQAGMNLVDPRVDHSQAYQEGAQDAVILIGQIESGEVVIDQRMLFDEKKNRCLDALFNLRNHSRINPNGSGNRLTENALQTKLGELPHPRRLVLPPPPSPIPPTCRQRFFNLFHSHTGDRQPLVSGTNQQSTSCCVIS